MKVTCLEPPSCCFIAETESGALRYRMAGPLDEIRRLRSLSQAAQAAVVDSDHARELLEDMIRSFREPLVECDRSCTDLDNIRLTRLGDDTVNWYWQKFGTVWSSILQERCKQY
jgi:molybdenum-dependent DNA-binding transcriptional regulator ModE